MILVVTVSQLKTSVPCDRIMQENKDMECVVAVNERKKKATTTKRTQKNTCNWISQPYSNKKKNKRGFENK